MTQLFKLADQHFIMMPQQRQNVRSETELLSHTTSMSLRRYYLENEDARRLAHRKNVWFSVSNTHTPTTKLVYKKSR